MTSLFSLVDNITKDPAVNSFEDLIQYFKKQVGNIVFYGKGKINVNAIIARIVFMWTVKNIGYDVEKYEYYFKEGFDTADGSYVFDPSVIFTARKGICGDYCNFFHHLCIRIGMKEEDVICIQGKVKLQSMDKSVELLGTAPHAWNAVKINDTWKLVDCTFGAGFIISKTKEFKKSLNLFYFFPDAIHLIYSHFPNEPQHQFIYDEQGTHPISFEEWMSLPIVHTNMFVFQIFLLSQSLIPSTRFNHISLLKESKTFAFVTIPLVTPTDIVICVNLKRMKDDIYLFDNTKVDGQPLKENKSQKFTQILCVFDSPGRFFLDVFAGKINDSNHYICTFKFLVEDVSLVKVFNDVNNKE